ncbi:MAG: hydantoinase B/oxoprolinase family protein [Bdellovibrionales bacterium]|nr:hydantoinase B/oxoprolinase family protein [Bdellovibrionales bacterium]
MRSGFDIFKTSISKSLIQQYNQSSKKLLEEIISQMPLGESQIKEKLDDGETVQLRIENNGSQLTFDFQGTTNSKKYFLTESAVLGCCLAALKCFTNSSFPINAGSLECLKVNTPTNSWLSSRYPSPSFLGMSEGTRLLSELSLTALSKLGRQKDLAQSSMSLCLVDIEFQSGAHFYDTTPGGVGARNG